MSKHAAEATLTTHLAVEAVAWERAPRFPKRLTNRRVVCADGFKVSVQASQRHYAQDSHPSGISAYHRSCSGDESVVHPFTEFELGAASEAIEPDEVPEKYDSGGVWAFVPRQIVGELLDNHGGAHHWENA